VSIALVGSLFTFFFQAEDGIRDFHVTGVQTCALPICERLAKTYLGGPNGLQPRPDPDSMSSPVYFSGAGGLMGTAEAYARFAMKIGRASCRERGERSGHAGAATTNAQDQQAHRGAVKG